MHTVPVFWYANQVFKGEYLSLLPLPRQPTTAQLNPLHILSYIEKVSIQSIYFTPVLTFWLVRLSVNQALCERSINNQLIEPSPHLTFFFFIYLFYLNVYIRAVRLIEIEIKSRFEIARFLNRFIALFFFFFFFLRPAPTSRSMLSEPIRMQQNRTDRAYRQIVC